MEFELDHSFTNELKPDELDIPVARQTPGVHFAYAQPKECSQPHCIAVSVEMLSTLNIKIKEADCLGESVFAQIFTGNQIPDGMKPFAMNYGGHQFGNWAGQLGDGRAINLGTIILENNLRRSLQLKGAGPTAYSRKGDGFAVLRSSVREFLCSEAMFHLGVSSTRALSLSLSGDNVVRDMFYDGHAQEEPGAIVCRVSESFIRFGHFEIFSARGEIEELKILADYTIKSHFPQIEPGDYIGFLKEVTNSTANLMIDWMRVGFVHGVMNTDNLSILGETIDYGPYGWLESYDPNWTPNTTDSQNKRYAFGAQPSIARWNITQLANALFPLVNDVQPLQEVIDQYSVDFNSKWRVMMGNKLGIKSLSEEDDFKWILDLLKLLSQVEVDYVLIFRTLAKLDLNNYTNLTIPLQEEILFPDILKEAFYNEDELTESYCQVFIEWIQIWSSKLNNDSLQNFQVNHESQKLNYQMLMDQTNPLYVMRNYLAQEAIDLAHQGDYSRIHEMLHLLKTPYTEQKGKEHFAAKRPEWARVKPGCSMLSCSS